MKTHVDRPPRRKDGPRTLGFVERVTLFVAAMHRHEAAELLHGFCEQAQLRARPFAQAVAGWDSARRQARLAHEFGQRHDADERLRALALEAPGGLHPALASRVPATLKGIFREGSGEGESASEAMRALAARLVREAAR